MSPSKMWSIIWWRGNCVPSISSWNTNSSRGSISPRRALRSHSSRRLCASGSTVISKQFCSFCYKKMFLFVFCVFFINSKIKCRKKDLAVDKNMQKSKRNKYYLECIPLKPILFASVWYKSVGKMSKIKKRTKNDLLLVEREKQVKVFHTNTDMLLDMFCFAA